ncbi:hypothetical protein MD484_g481, partial [Candolleomyces efflorescens]
MGLRLSALAPVGLDVDIIIGSTPPHSASANPTLRVGFSCPLSLTTIPTLMASNSKSFSHLFETNVAPRPLEAASIQGKVDSLTSDITGVKSQLERLRRELGRLETRRDGYQAVLSPLRRMPLEILGEIFLTILAGIDPEKSKRFKDVTLIDLCLVCRAWRNAALATPRLWNFLVLKMLPRRALRHAAVSHWFSRSGVASKTLYIYGYSHGPCDSEGPEGCDFANVGLVKLLTEGTQLGHLFLRCASPQCFRNLIDLMKRAVETRKPRPWDTIKSLKFVFTCDWNEPPSLSESIFLHIPSSVTTLHLFLPPYNDLQMSEDNLNLHIPESILSNLTTFTLECDWSGTKICKILQLCKNVENLTLDFGFAEVPFNDDLPYITEVYDAGLLLPKVTTLRLHHLPPHLIYILNFLKTPMLVELDLSLSNFAKSPAPCADLEEVTDIICLALVSFSDSVRTHRKLRLHAMKLTKTQINLLFNGLKRLSHLTFDNVWFDGSVFRDILHEQWDLLGRHPALPSIETLELLNLPIDFPLRYLKQYVEERSFLEASDSTCLKKVVATYQEYDCPITSEDATYKMEHCPVEFRVGFVKSGSE